MSTSETIGKLAAEIGETVYIDIAKWHLYLNDAKLHTPLAEKFYPMLIDGEISAGVVAETLQSFNVSLGGGKKEVSLGDLVPSSCQNNLVNLLADFRRDL